MDTHQIILIVVIILAVLAIIKLVKNLVVVIVLIAILAGLGGFVNMNLIEKGQELVDGLGEYGEVADKIKEMGMKTSIKYNGIEFNNDEGLSGSIKYVSGSIVQEISADISVEENKEKLIEVLKQIKVDNNRIDQLIVIMNDGKDIVVNEDSYYLNMTNKMLTIKVELVELVK